MYEYAVRVGFCVGYPIIPDAYTTWVRVAADTDTQARLIACQMVSTRYGHATSAVIEEMIL